MKCAHTVSNDEMQSLTESKKVFKLTENTLKIASEPLIQGKTMKLNFYKYTYFQNHSFGCATKY